MIGELLGGLTKIFTSLGTGAATLGSAVRAVGSTLFTGMAASGGAQGLGGLMGGGGVLGNILGGALQQGLASGLIGGIGSSISGGGFGEGFKTGAITGAISGGVGSGLGSIGSLFQPTGMGTATGFDSGLDMAGGPGTVGGAGTLYGGGGSPLAGGAGTDPNAVAGGTLRRIGGAGSNSNSFAPSAGAPATTTTAPANNIFPPAPAAPAPPTLGAGWKGFGEFLNSNAGAGLIGGIGESLLTERILEARQEEAEANRQYLRDEQKRRTDSYNLPNDAFLGGAKGGGKVATDGKAGPKWTYNPGTGMIDYA